MTPPAGPDNTVCTGFSRADAAVMTPPEDSITIRLLVTLFSRWDTYLSMTGIKYAFMTVVLILSYSLNSGNISLEIHTGIVTMDFIFCSWTGLA